MGCQENKQKKKVIFKELTGSILQSFVVYRGAKPNSACQRLALKTQVWQEKIHKKLKLRKILAKASTYRGILSLHPTPSSPIDTTFAPKDTPGTNLS